MISVSEADDLLRGHVRRTATEHVPLHEAAGRVLRETVRADRSQPPFDRVAMDGVALAYAGIHAGGVRFRRAGVQAAGEPPLALPDTAACIEIMTGAVLPHGCDTVVPYEALDLGDEAAVLRAPEQVRAGQNIHRQGSDRAAGDAVVAPGAVLGPTHVAALAAVGQARVAVAARPRLRVLTTGDELVAIDAPVLPHQIRRSNGAALRAALEQAGHRPGPPAHASDRAEALHAALGEALAHADVVVLTGGVSAGRFDLVPSVLAGLGVAEVFHRVRQRPGKPLWFGVGAGGPAVFGLPGNPVSALVGLYRYVLPFLDACAGAHPAAPLRLPLTALPVRKNTFTHFVPVRRDGAALHLVRTSGSGDFFSILASDGFAEVEAEQRQPGLVAFHPWRLP